MQVPVLRIETPDQPEVIARLEASDACHAGLCPVESNHMVDLGTLQDTDTTFCAARVDGAVRGIGAIMRQPGYAGIKRMFVNPAVRGLKLGNRILGAMKKVVSGSCSQPPFTFTGWQVSIKLAPAVPAAPTPIPSSWKRPLP